MRNQPIVVYLFGHTGLAIVIYMAVEFIYNKQNTLKTDRNMLLIAIGSMLPDFLDKPIGSLLFNSGRWLGHSIFFQLSILILLLVTGQVYPFHERYNIDVVLLFIGSNIHLIGDLPSITATVVFWPLYGQFPTGASNSFLMGFQSPMTVFTETLGFIAIVMIGIKERWPRKYWNFLGIVAITYLMLFSVTYIILVGL